MTAPQVRSRCLANGNGVIAVGIVVAVCAVLTACANDALTVQGATSTAVASTSAASASKSPWEVGCDPIGEAKSRLDEVAPWESLDQMTAEADLIFAGRVESVSARAPGVDRPSYPAGESPPVSLDAVIRVSDVMVGDRTPGESVVVLAGAESRTGAGECTVLTEGQTVTIGTVHSPRVDQQVFVNVDSVFYSDDQGGLASTGRDYGGIAEIERLSFDELVSHLASPTPTTSGEVAGVG